MPFASHRNAGKYLGGLGSVGHAFGSALGKLASTWVVYGGVSLLPFAAQRHAGKDLGGARGELNMACLFLAHG